MLLLGKFLLCLNSRFCNAAFAVGRADKAPGFTLDEQDFMYTQDQYISIAGYIAGLHFDHVATYSFQRGAGYEENLAMQLREQDSLKRRREEAGAGKRNG